MSDSRFRIIWLSLSLYMYFSLSILTSFRICFVPTLCRNNSTKQIASWQPIEQVEGRHTLQLAATASSAPDAFRWRSRTVDVVVFASLVVCVFVLLVNVSLLYVVVVRYGTEILCFFHEKVRFYFILKYFSAHRWQHLLYRVRSLFGYCFLTWRPERGGL